MTKLNGNLYREVRSDFVRKVRENPNISDYYKEQILNASEVKRQMYENNRAHLQGGDADRKYYELKYPPVTRCIECRRLTEQMPHNAEHQGTHASVEINQSTPVNMVPSVDVRINSIRDKDCSFVSSLGSVLSKKSSSTTLQTKVSARELRQRVKSQCQMHVVVDESIKRINNSELDDKWLGPRHADNRTLNIDIPDGRAEIQQGIEKIISPSMPSNCEMPMRQNHKQLQTDNYNDPFLYTAIHCSDVFRAPLDDVVNSKIINPMIRKMQRIYINNLKEEMSILEDLERMPSQVNSLYKASFYDMPNIEDIRDKAKK